MHCNCVSIPDKNHDLQKLHHVHHLSSKPIMKAVKAYFHLGITGRQKYSINKQYFFKVLCKCLQRQINILINDNTHPQLALTVTETFSGALYTRLTDETISYIIINKKKKLKMNSKQWPQHNWNVPLKWIHLTMTHRYEECRPSQQKQEGNLHMDSKHIFKSLIKN